MTDRTGGMLTVEADHRAHATVELDIRDLKAGGLAHIPSGVFFANAAWLALAVLAHNLGRWTLHAAGGQWAGATVATLRTKLVGMPARVVRSARTIKLRFPRNWPWKDAYDTALTTIRASPRAHLTAAASTPVRHNPIALTPEPRPAATTRPHPGSSRPRRLPRPPRPPDHRQRSIQARRRSTPTGQSVD